MKFNSLFEECLKNWYELKSKHYARNKTSREIDNLLSDMFIFGFQVNLSDYSLQFKKGMDIDDFENIQFDNKISYKDRKEVWEQMLFLKPKLHKIFCTSRREFKNGQHKIDAFRFKRIKGIALVNTSKKLVAKMIDDGVAERMEDNTIVPTDEYNTSECVAGKTRIRWNIVFIKTNYPEYCGKLTDLERSREP